MPARELSIKGAAVTTFLDSPCPTVFHTTKPAPGTTGPLIPGDPEREAEAIRSKEGIPRLKPVVDDLLEIAKKTGIPFKLETGRLAVKKTTIEIIQGAGQRLTMSKVAAEYFQRISSAHSATFPVTAADFCGRQR